MDIIVIALLWFFIVPFIGIRLLFFGGFQSNRQEYYDDEFYWEEKKKRKPLVDNILGFTFLLFFLVFVHLTFWPITTMLWPEISPIISSLWS